MHVNGSDADYRHMTLKELPKMGGESRCMCVGERSSDFLVSAGVQKKQPFVTPLFSPKKPSDRKSLNGR
jgi:hypothetical protein